MLGPMTLHHRRAVLAVLLASATLGACARGGATPQDALRAYSSAVRSGDADRAWALTTTDYRAAHSRERFEAEFEARAAGGDAYADQLAEAADGAASVSAELPYSEFETLSLRYVDGQWRIVDGVGDLFSQATPRDTLQTFVRAVRANDATALLRLVPAEFRARITEDDLAEWLAARSDELAETVAKLEASADAPIPERDGRAVLRYGAEQMVFALEDGRWVIADFD